MFRLLPPAGAPVSLTAVLGSTVPSRNRRQSLDNLRALIRKLSGQRHCFFVNSGKTALYAGLKALSAQADLARNEVIVPAYTCYTVPAAVVRAGFKVRPVDIDPGTMDYDYQQLSRVDFSRVLAVIGDNLFGIPSNWARLKSLAGEHGVFLIDDAAQAMGLEYCGGPAGSQGDFGFYSMGRGKNISTYSGGILVTDNDTLADSIDDTVSLLPSSGSFDTLIVAIKLVLLSLFLRPRLYWIPSMLPFLGLGETVFDKNFPLGKLSALQISLAAASLDRLGHFARQRRENAKRLAGAIGDLPGLELPGFDTINCPSYLRLPVLLPNGEMRATVAEQLRQCGIAASTMYPDSIDRIEALGKDIVVESDEFPGARDVVDRLITLPTHPYVTEADIDRIIKVLTSTLSGQS